jgi:hypothetical protein
LSCSIANTASGFPAKALVTGFSDKTYSGRCSATTSIRCNFGNAYKHEKLDLNSPWSSFVTPFKVDQWKHEIAPILLGHARLYVFTQMYMIVELKERALGKLCEYLVQLEIYPLTRGPIIELLGYAYDTDNITDREEDVSIDPLREMVLNFIHIHEEVFCNFSDYQKALKMHSEYVVDLMALLHAELNAERQKRDSVEKELRRWTGVKDFNWMPQG